MAKMSHLYGDVYHAESDLNTFKEVLDMMEVVSLVRDNEEYGSTDLERYGEFLVVSPALSRR